MSKATLPDWPGYLRRARAAQYLDVSTTKFDELVREGIMPAPITRAGVKLWSRAQIDLVMHDCDPDGAEGGLASCDAVFPQL
ncbi:hypothetical protein [Roseinatronobacter bogoriensis]|uniref:hypothetical protein n=1 Tax=Roseinatronobacter bogoriensis TaxID=119542 RepID=UPI0008F877AC|nr:MULTISPECIES: hypothetical protein [Rhodobaca]MBB4209148.1 hypothetical protein [Rhodobaca bogoriensis DSM 18756]TDW36324.1 AlpA family transcriptional regulator [Rhodobaca barguzinensis]TDY67548.1 hypothetical protein EV660_10761 [Rhodobaca bogoriensis DSM 18756]